SHADKELILSSITRSLENPKHVDAFETLFSQLPDTSPSNVVHEILDTKRQNVGLELSAALMARASSEQIQPLLTEFNSLTEGGLEEEEQDLTAITVEDLVTKHFDKEELIKLSPKTLNNRVGGGVKPGHHILIYAPTEMGKTLFAINMVVGFLRQGKTVLYIGNEDPIADVAMRFICRMCSQPQHKIEANPAKAQKMIEMQGWDRLILKELAPGTFPQIRGLIGKHKPDVVVIDQLRNIDVKSENRTTALEKAATEARNIAKGGVVVISLTQAADSASGKLVLNRGDVDSSNIGIPGNMDVMIGIGANEDMERTGLRCISLAKNKTTGNHSPFNVLFNTAISKVEEL
ncbi:hypothetical protein LCGC14_2820370, partial [marine sediment metagenome]